MKHARELAPARRDRGFEVTGMVASGWKHFDVSFPAFFAGAVGA